MSKYVKNNSGSVDAWLGKQLAVNEVYQIPCSHYERWQSESRQTGSKVYTDINSGALQISKDGTVWMSTADALEWMQHWNSGAIGGNIALAAPTDGQILRYNGTTKKWEPKSADILEGGMSTISFHLSGSANDAWLNAPYGEALGQNSSVVPFVIPFDFQVLSMMITNKKSDADMIVKIHKNMNLVTPAYTWTLPNDRIWAVKNSGLSSWSFNQFDKISVMVSKGSNNGDDIYFEINGYYRNKNLVDGGGSNF